MDNAKIELDQCLAVWVYDGLNCIQHFDIPSMISGLDVRKLLKVDIMSDLSERTALGRVLKPYLIVRTQRQDLWVVYGTCA